eukprot:SAG11_NODE_20997_length_434_cov_0.919403_1_plen_48_part_10
MAGGAPALGLADCLLRRVLVPVHLELSASGGGLVGAQGTQGGSKRGEE